MYAQCASAVTTSLKTSYAEKIDHCDKSTIEDPRFWRTAGCHNRSAILLSHSKDIHSLWTCLLKNLEGSVQKERNVKPFTGWISCVVVNHKSFLDGYYW